MNSETKKDEIGAEGWVAAWRRWAGRPPRLSPEDAARRVQSRIAVAERPARFRLALAGACAVLVLAAGAWLATRPRSPQTRSASAMTPPLPENVVVWWLDPETPVYFVTQPVERQ